MRFGERLARIRQARGWSQQELADRSGVPYITIYRCERGQHQEPRVSVAAKLARALGVSLDVLADTYGDREQDKGSEFLPTAVALAGV
jgi:transcriptional regulator with XRE-family HTH domain